MYSNGMQPYVTAALDATKLAGNFVYAKGRTHRNESTAKRLADKLFPYNPVIFTMLAVYPCCSRLVALFTMPFDSGVGVDRR